MVDPKDETLDLNELAQRADVTPRTVRYYVQQGLLPPPASRGVGAHYTRSHLDRLALIKRMQREHVPLAEIRKRLGALDDAAVHSLVQSPAEPQNPSALGYVRELLSRDTGAKESVPWSAPTPATAGERGQWERITLTPDIELHVRRPLTRAHNRIVDRLVEYALHLFSKEP